MSDPTGLLTWNDVIAGCALIAGVALEFIPGGQWFGTALIVSGFSHFASTIDHVQNSNGQIGWNKASNIAGINFDGSINFNGPNAKEGRHSKSSDVFNYSNDNYNQFTAFGDTETYDPANISNYQKNANEYNGSLSAVGQESQLECYYSDQYGIQEGNYNISDITTIVGVGYGLTAEGRYVNFKDKSIALGYTIPVGNGKQEIHISPYAVSYYNSLTFFRSIAGHELTHAYIYSIAPNTPRYISERAAYQYSYNEFMSHGQINNAMKMYNFANSMNYWGAYPANFNLPGTYYTSSYFH